MANLLMRSARLVIAFAIGTTCSSGALGVPVQEHESPLIEQAYVDPDGIVHVVERGRDKSIPKEKDQVQASSPKIADDKRTVGWAVDYKNCCTSYPIPLVVLIYRDGKIQQRLNRGGLMIYDWRFWADGKQVAFCTGTVHGDSGGHCELHDSKSGRLLATITGHLDNKSPAWARGLQN